MIDRKRAEEVFYAYTGKYDMGNSLIRHKVEHTLRVAGFCEQIAVSQHMNEDDVDFSWLLGLLHDIGRFEQVRRYGTFVDAISVNHAEFGADLLFREGLIEDYPVRELAPEWLSILETAIRLHNRLRLPEELDDRTRCFCNLIRDADKVDIFRVISELPFEERVGPGKDLIGEADEASDAVMDCVFEHHCVPRAIRKTRFEGHVSHCCMAFELMSAKSRELTKEQRFLYRLLSGCDEDGKALWNEKELAQLRVVRNEIENAWGEPLTEDEPLTTEGQATE